MNPATPQIGFDRFIALDWAAAALRVRADMGTIEDLDALLDSARRLCTQEDPDRIEPAMAATTFRVG
jgi:hypothetical protein